MSTLARYALYAVLILTVLAGAWWAFWQILSALTELFAQCLVLLFIGVVGAELFGNPAAGAAALLIR